MKTYHARVERGDRYWIVDVEELHRATQARHLRELDRMTRDLVSVMTGERPEAFEVEYLVEVPAPAREHLEAARRLRDEASKTQAAATEEWRVAVRTLQDQGLTLRDIGEVLGVSFQRAQQLAAGRPTARAS